ncbi:hypothetical protein C5E41_18480 [Nocardia nova]|nr:hypothetical protein C5E41_18480 [Nocardia nova]
MGAATALGVMSIGVVSIAAPAAPYDNANIMGRNVIRDMGEDPLRRQRWQYVPPTQGTYAETAGLDLLRTVTHAVFGLPVVVQLKRVMLVPAGSDRRPIGAIPAPRRQPVASRLHT